MSSMWLQKIFRLCEKSSKPSSMFCKMQFLNWLINSSLMYCNNGKANTNKTNVVILSIPTTQTKYFIHAGIHMNILPSFKRKFKFNLFHKVFEQRQTCLGQYMFFEYWPSNLFLKKNKVFPSNRRFHFTYSKMQTM